MTTMTVYIIKYSLYDEARIEEGAPLDSLVLCEAGQPVEFATADAAQVWTKELAKSLHEHSYGWAYHELADNYGGDVPDIFVIWVEAVTPVEGSVINMKEVGKETL